MISGMKEFEDSPPASEPGVDVVEDGIDWITLGETAGMLGCGA